MMAHRLEEAERTDDIGLHERFRPVDGSVNMAFSCKVQDGTWAVRF